MPTPTVTPTGTPIPDQAPSPSPEPATPPQPAPDVKTQANSPPDASSDVPKVKTELVVGTDPSLKPAAEPTPNDNAVAKTERRRRTDTDNRPSPSETPKPLFEPIIITIPRADSPKNTPTEQRTERPTLEINNTDGRGRIIDGKPVQTIDPDPCQIFVNQDKISLVSDGGMLSILVGVEKGNSLSDVRFVISDPEDISVTLDPDVTGLEGRALYTIRSTSGKTGNFRVTFYLPCGKKDVTVSVR